MSTASFAVLFSGDEPRKWLTARNNILKVLRKENCIEIIEEEEFITRKLDEPEGPSNEFKYIKPEPSKGKSKKSTVANDEEENDTADYELQLEEFKKQYKIEMKSHMEDLKLFYSINESYKKDFREYEKKKSRAFKILDESIGNIARSNVTEEIKNYSPRDMWFKLESIYMSTDSDIDQGTLMEMITNITIDRNESFGNYISRLQDIIEGINTRDKTEMIDSWKLSFMVNGIAKNADRYRIYEDDIKMARNSKYNYSETIEHIRAEEIIRASKKKMSSVPIMAAQKKPNKELDRGIGPCKKCDQPHDVKYCKNKLYCNNCKKEGHMTKKCFKGPSNVQVSAMVSKGTVDTNLVIIDSGAAMHVTGDENKLTDKREVEELTVVGYDGSESQVNIKGQLEYFGDTLLVPGSKNTLVSMTQLKDDGFRIQYNDDTDTWTTVDSQDEMVEFKRVVSNGHGVYAMVDRSSSSSDHDDNVITDQSYLISDINAITRVNQSTGSNGGFRITKDMIKRAREVRKMHEILGHPSDAVLTNMLINGNILNCKFGAKDIRDSTQLLGVCMGCVKGKMTKPPMHKSDREPRKDIGELIHVDLFEIERGDRYMVSVDDKTGYIISVQLDGKSAIKIADAINKVVKIYRNNGHRLGKYVDIQSDSEACFISAADIDNMSEGENRVRFNTIAPETHEKIAERTIRSIKDKFRSILHSKKGDIPEKLYGYILEWTIQGINAVSNVKTGSSTPRELVTGVKLDYKREFKLNFGEKALFRVPYAETNSTNARAEIGIVVGKVLNSNGIYKVYVPERNRVVRRFYYKTLGVDIETPIAINDSEDVVEEDTDYLYWSDPEKDNVVDVSHMSVKKSLLQYGESAEKAIYEELAQMVHKSVWRPVMYDSLSEIYRNNIIESLMFVKMKLTTDMKGDRLKARFCADPTRKYVGRGKSIYRPTVKEGQFYAPTINLQTLMTVLGVASYKGMKYRMKKDVTGAFLIPKKGGGKTYMVINREMSQILVKYFPEYLPFVGPDGCIVVEVLNAIYGLQEAPAKWNEHIHNKLIEIGAVQSKNDDCLYMIKKGTKSLYITIFVDDLYIVSDDKDMLDDFDSKFKEKYPNHTTEVGDELEYLGMKISYDKTTKATSISQVGYVNSILEKYLVDGKVAKTPSTLTLFEENELENGGEHSKNYIEGIGDPHGGLGNDDRYVNDLSEEVNQKDYMSKVMTLLYLAKRTRPDILKEVTYLSSKNLCPNRSDWDKLNRIFAYLNYTKDQVLCINVDKLEVVVYVDASYLVHSDMKGHTGGVIMLGEKGGTTLAISRKQKVLARSSTEAELIAIEELLQYAIFAKDLVSELTDTTIKVKVYEDNMSTIKLCNNGKSNNISTKHIKKKYFVIKEYLDEGTVYLEHLSTEDMIADLLTKPIIGHRFVKLRDLLLGSRVVIDK